MFLANGKTKATGPYDRIHFLNYYPPLNFFINLKLEKKFPEFCGKQHLQNVCQEACNLF